MTRALTLGAITFPTKKAAETRIREILHGTSPNTPLTGVDLEIVTALVERHPHASDKIGPGIDVIDVRAIEMGSPGFWITRVDGTCTDFSYRKALSAPSHRQRVTNALRRGIEESIVEFKCDLFRRRVSVTCPLTGQPLGWRDGHVDHVVPFAALVDDWLEAMGLTYEDVALLPPSDGVVGDRLADPSLRDAWKAWHDEHAVLRYIHPGANARRHAPVSGERG